MKTESTFEKRIIRHFRSMGWFAAHLNGSPGWPDVIATYHGRVRFFELKSLRVADWRELEMKSIFEQSQYAFVIANPMVEVMALLATDDGDFIFHLSPETAKRIPDGLRFRDIGIQPWRCNAD
jgi:hypothetical protein